MTSNALQVAQFGWSILLSLLTFGVWLYAWVSSRSRARQGELEALRDAHEKRLRTVEEDANTLEERIRHLPTAAELSRLQSTLSGVSAIIDTINQRTTRIENYLSDRRTAV